MPTTHFIGPLAFEFAAGGLAPGQVTPTVWTINPPPERGTVTFTAIPVGGGTADINGPDGVRLAVRDPTVQVEGQLGGLKFTLHADVANVGKNTAFKANMFITYIEA